MKSVPRIGPSARHRRRGSAGLIALAIALLAFDARAAGDARANPFPGPPATGVLAEWRAVWTDSPRADDDTIDALVVHLSPLRDDLPEPHRQLLRAWLAANARTLAVVRPSGRDSGLVFPRTEGPETPFPDAHFLQTIARLRLVATKLHWHEGDRAAALAEAEANLHLAEAIYRAQESTVMAINATGIWATALDGVYWLARRPDLAAAEAARLAAALAAQEGLIDEGFARGVRGEWRDIFRPTVERMPDTQNPVELLAAVATLGLDPPEEREVPANPFAPIVNPLLDKPATIAAYAAMVERYLAAIAASPAHDPAAWGENVIAPLRAGVAELGAFFAFATADTESTEPDLAAVQAVLERVRNPFGTLLTVFLMPPWESMRLSALRREATRRALLGLLAWRQHGAPAEWAELVAAGRLSTVPLDPYDGAPLRVDLSGGQIWSIGPDLVDHGGAGDGENLGDSPDLVWTLGPSGARSP